MQLVMQGTVNYDKLWQRIEQTLSIIVVDVDAF